MFKRGNDAKRFAWLLPLLVLSPLELGAKGCDTGIVGNECPADAGRAGTCVETGGRPGGGNDEKGGASGSATGGASGNPGTGGAGAANDVCGGLRGLSCADGEYCQFPPDADCGAADRTGQCVAKPEVCPEIYAPVCGCNDKTYGNDCEAARAGVSVASEGECAVTPAPTGECGGLRGLTCAEGEYCSYAPEARCGAADQTGKCVEQPEACDAIYKPVCGCDGKTYSNDCVAALAGVSVASQGECNAAATCGGLLGLQCAKGEFCNFPVEARCGAADQTGVCETVPEACTQELDPVCGCDGVTYGNACTAAMAGVSVSSTGACADDPGTGHVCGGLQGVQCDKGEYCDYPKDALCGRADATGNCATIPSACTKEYNPVCGCDGNTYSNPCMAAAAGVSVETSGACAGDGDPNGTACGSRGLPECPKGQYCSFPTEAMCGAADQPGTCADMPEACTQNYDPVCGCDGMTYGNACSAASAGVSVQATDACP